MLDSQLRVISANRSFHETFGTAPEQVRGPVPSDAQRRGCGTFPRCEKVSAGPDAGQSFEGFEMECDLRQAGLGRWCSAPGPSETRLSGAGLILVVLQDVTVCRRQEQEIQTDKQQLASLTEELMLIEERQRRQIAEILHDSVGESLTQVEQELDALRRDAPAAMRDSLQRLREQVRRAVEWTGEPGQGTQSGRSFVRAGVGRRDSRTGRAVPRLRRLRLPGDRRVGTAAVAFAGAHLAVSGGSRVAGQRDQARRGQQRGDHAGSG